MRVTGPIHREATTPPGACYAPSSEGWMAEGDDEERRETNALVTLITGVLGGGAFAVLVGLILSAMLLVGTAAGLVAVIFFVCA